MSDETKKSCGNCTNCEKFKDNNGKETWTCEEYGFFYVGMPVDVTPPHDDVCELWTDDVDKSNSWKRFV